ncbi:unnamed protein product [Urochloa humidicola]
MAVFVDISPIQSTQGKKESKQGYKAEGKLHSRQSSAPGSETYHNMHLEWQLSQGTGLALALPLFERLTQDKMQEL